MKYGLAFAGVGAIFVIGAAVIGVSAMPQNDSSNQASTHTPPFTMASNSYDVTAKVDGIYLDNSGSLNANGDVLVKLTLTNNSNSYYNYGPNDFGLQWPDGNVETWSFKVESNLNGALQGLSKIAPNGHVTGYVGFSMTNPIDSTKGLTLTWLPAEVGSNYKTISLSDVPSLTTSQVTSY